MALPWPVKPAIRMISLPLLRHLAHKYFLRLILTRSGTTLQSLQARHGRDHHTQPRATQPATPCAVPKSRTLALSWRFRCSSGRSPVLADDAVDNAGALDLGGHIDRLTGLV
jgi:hypothetical protein